MKFIARRMLTCIITLLFISIVTFFAFTVLPGDASVSKLGTEATPERIAQLREEMGLDQPVMIRYIKWLEDACHLDFGNSYQYEGILVRDLMGERFLVTALLSCLSFVMIVLISYPLGVYCGKHKGELVERVIDFFVRVNMAIPPFFLGILLTYFFGIFLRVFVPGAFVFPKGDFFGCIWFLFFPALAITIPKSAMMIKFIAETIKKESLKEYVRTAYSKGCTKNRVYYKHILKNVMIPVVTFLALILVDIISGSLVIEQVFSVPGIGRLLVTAISNRDFPIVQGVVLLFTVIVVVINTIVDVVYQLLDRRLV